MERYKPCPECGDLYLLNKDGTVRKHYKPGTHRELYCSGSGRLPEVAK